MTTITELVNNTPENEFSIESIKETVGGKLENYPDRRRFYNYGRSNFYLINIRQTDEECCIKVSGTSLNLYDVRINSTSRCIKCDCPDGSGYCAGRDVLCKHSYFALISVLRMKELADSYFWQTKKFSPAEIEIAFNRCRLVWENYRDIQVNYINEVSINRYILHQQEQGGAIEATANEATANEVTANEATANEATDSEATANEATASEATTEEPPKPIDKFKPSHISCEDELCPVCYQEMEKPEDLVRCPTCKNNMHEECINIWFRTGKSTCVMCRSEVWNEYLREKKAELPEHIYTRIYTNLYDLMIG